MLHLRQLIRPLVVLALLATAVSLAASAASAQELKVFVFTNSEPAGSDWEVRVTVESLGGCGVTEGHAGGSSGWLEAEEEWGEILNLVCVYTVTAIARNEVDETGKVCDTVLGWGSGTPTEDELRTRAADRGSETDANVQHADPLDCDAAIVATFTIDPEEVVEELPASAADDGLQARAERAVEVADFEVHVKPDDSTKNRRGCNQVFVFTMRGGQDGEVEKSLAGIPESGSCKFRATITNAPAPFDVVTSDGKLFNTEDASGGDLEVDLSGLLNLPYGRIAIIQDVTGSDNQGVASYKIDRSCAGVGTLPPTIVAGGGAGIYTTAGGKVVATLSEGRFTVHSDAFANFGPGANYLAIARSLTSNTISGCSVSVTIQEFPSTCSVSPSTTQTLTWRDGVSFENFDFEFDISCGGAPARPSTGTSLPPGPPGGSASTDDTSSAVAAAGADVRIVARKLPNGKIEFGLQQQQSDDSWGDRRLPQARLFPTTASVGSWLQSTPVNLSVAMSSDSFAEEIDVRIIARRTSSGRVEFGLQHRQSGGSWSDRQLPSRRFFPPNTTVNSWLASSPLSLDG